MSSIHFCRPTAGKLPKFPHPVGGFAQIAHHQPFSCDIVTLPLSVVPSSTFSRPTLTSPLKRPLPPSVRRRRAVTVPVTWPRTLTFEPSIRGLDTGAGVDRDIAGRPEFALDLAGDLQVALDLEAALQSIVGTEIDNVDTSVLTQIHRLDQRLFGLGHVWVPSGLLILGLHSALCEGRSRSGSRTRNRACRAHKFVPTVDSPCRTLVMPSGQDDGALRIALEPLEQPWNVSGSC